MTWLDVTFANYNLQRDVQLNKNKQNKKGLSTLLGEALFQGFIVAGGGHIFLLYVQYTLYTSLLEI